MKTIIIDDPLYHDVVDENGNPLDLFTPTGFESQKHAKIRKEKLKTAMLEKLKGGAGSGNFGHAGRPGKVGGSAPDSSAPAPSSSPDVAIAGRLLRIVKSHPWGFSYKPHDGFAKKGYMVAIEGHEVEFAHKEATLEKMLDYVRQTRDIMNSNKRYHYGGWLDSETGNVCLDISERCDSLKVAWNKGKKNKRADGKPQNSIWDVVNMEEIPVGDLDAPPEKWRALYDSSPESEV